MIAFWYPIEGVLSEDEMKHITLFIAILTIFAVTPGIAAETNQAAFGETKRVYATYTKNGYVISVADAPDPSLGVDRSKAEKKKPSVKPAAEVKSKAKDGKK